MSPERIPVLERRLTDAERELARNKWRDRALICLGVFWVVLCVGFGVYIISAKAIQDQVADAVNGVACPARAALQEQVARARQAKNDKTLPRSERLRRVSSERSTKRWLRALKTVPPDFDCDKLIAELDAQNDQK